MGPMRSRAAAFVGSALFFLFGGVVFAGAASAHHPEINGTWGCDGVVTFTAAAWMGDGSDESRTNPSIDVAWSEDGTAPWTAITAGSFSAGNGFHFTDTFVPVTSAEMITLRVTEAGPWANGEPARSPGNEDGSQFTVVHRSLDCQPPLEECPGEGGEQLAFLRLAVEGRCEEPPVEVTPTLDPPTAVIADATCIDDGAVVSLRNPSPADTAFTISGGPSPVVRTVPAGATAHVLVPVGTVPVSIAVSANGMSTVTRTLAQDCTPPAANPSAAVADAMCPEEGALVTLTNTGSAPVTFTLTGPDGAVTRDVPAGGEGSEVVRLPGGGGTVIVSAPGMADVTRSFDADDLQCTFVLAEVVERPAPPVAAAAQMSGELPRTGSTTEDLARMGGALLLVGLALALAPVVGRRRLTIRTTN